MVQVIFHKKIILSEKGWFPQIELESSKEVPFTPTIGLALNDKDDWKFIIKELTWDLEKGCFNAYSEPLRLDKDGWEKKKDGYVKAGWKVTRSVKRGT